eukprot:1136740-Pelagomonas_calceolata.AAC.2
MEDEASKLQVGAAQDSDYGTESCCILQGEAPGLASKLQQSVNWLACNQGWGKGYKSSAQGQFS